MRRLVAFLLNGSAWVVFGVFGALALLGLILTLLGGGIGGVPAYDDKQNTAFAKAVGEYPQLPAVAAAPPETAIRIVGAANHYLQFGDIPTTSAPDGKTNSLDAPPVTSTPPTPRGSIATTAGHSANWRTEYLCGLKGWGNHRPVIRKLVAEGYGDCPSGARFAARSPWIFLHGAAGMLSLVLMGLLALCLALFVPSLMAVRGGHDWLFRSSVSRPGG